MSPVYTLIVDGKPFLHTADNAPSIGEFVALDAADAVVRVLRSSDGGRIYVCEAAGRERS